MSKDYYPTSDLGLSASLITAGFKLLFLDKSNPKRVLFYFKFTNRIEVTVNHYWSDNLNVNARALFENTKTLKSRIYAEFNEKVLPTSFAYIRKEQNG